MDNSFNSRNTVVKKVDYGRRKSCVYISILGIVSLETSFSPQSRGQSGAANTGEGRDRWHLYKPKLKPSVIIIFEIVFVSSEIGSFSQSRGQTGAGNRNGGRGCFESDLFDAATYYLSEERRLRPACSKEKRDRSLLVLVIGSALALVIGSLQARVSILQIVALVVIGLQARVKI
ncbi:hypothetical protein ACB092_04G026500 [Castanea dentata]